MPSRNIVRFDLEEAYYHVYIRGIDKSAIFVDAPDKEFFISLLARHLSKKPFTNTTGYCYPHYRDNVELLAFCVLNNHTHLLFYQVQRGCVSEFMRSIMVAYTAYFNRKHTRRGPLFESRYKAKHVDSDSYLLHISRYIHLNPRNWKQYPYSSYFSIVNNTSPEWLQARRVLALFPNRQDYAMFVRDYVSRKKIIDATKAELADW